MLKSSRHHLTCFYSSGPLITRCSSRRKRCARAKVGVGIRLSLVISHPSRYLLLLLVRNLVAFYVYNQQKVAAERPPSNPSTEIIRDYSKEPVAWAPELPPDWHSQAVPPPSHQVSAHPTGNQSSQNLASLRGMTGNRRFQASPDHDFADLERDVMDGSEVDYGGVKSDIQEQSMGPRTPRVNNAVSRI